MAPYSTDPRFDDLRQAMTEVLAEKGLGDIPDDGITWSLTCRVLDVLAVQEASDAETLAKAREMARNHCRLTVNINPWTQRPTHNLLALLALLTEEDDYRKARGAIDWNSDKRPEEIIREMRDGS